MIFLKLGLIIVRSNGKLTQRHNTLLLLPLAKMKLFEATDSCFQINVLSTWVASVTLEDKNDVTKVDLTPIYNEVKKRLAEILTVNIL